MKAHEILAAADTVSGAVRQVVKDLQGNLLQDQRIRHVYTFANGRIRKMEIQGGGHGTD